MMRVRVALLTAAAVSLFTPSLAFLAHASGPIRSAATAQSETKPANCGTANTPPCEA